MKKNKAEKEHEEFMENLASILQNTCTLNREEQIIGEGEMTAGELVRVFSKLDPDARIANPESGVFVLENEDTLYNNETQQDDIDNHPQYGMITNSIMDIVNKYTTDNFENDIVSMDCDIAEVIVNNSQYIIDAVINSTKDMIDSLVNYQNAKNIRHDIEICRIVDKDK